MASIAVNDLRRFAGSTVGLRLVDGIVLVGRLRTSLLTEHSLSIFIANDDGGATVYIDQIDDVWVTEPTN